MRTTRCLGALALVLAASASIATAHPVTVDGLATEWSTRQPASANLGIVVRDAMGRGELVWRDAIGDTRTDVASPEVVADVAALQVTADPTGLYFLVRRAPGVVLAGAPIQIQIAIDLDRVAGSGQEFFSQFADTRVANGARWERLVTTLFGSGGAADVIDTAFASTGAAQAVQGVGGDVEIAVPWATLGLAGPPSTPLRFTVATFRAQANDLSVDVGGPSFSNALDAVTNYGDAVATAFPNTFTEVQDQVVDHAFDLHFRPNGEVYAPLIVQSFLPSSSVAGADEWYVVKNVTAASLPLDGFKLGDEETVDGSEGMLAFPAGATLAPGASFVVARSGAAYQSFFGVAPAAELPPGSSMAVPDMAPFTAWASGTVQLANAGDELLVLDPSNTIVDVATFGTGAYAGVTPFTPAPGTDQVLTRAASSADTDDCLVDFSNGGTPCASDAQCGGICFACTANVCAPKMSGASCADADLCDGTETCDGAGTCAAGTMLVCDDADPCTVDTCDMSLGCQTAPAMMGTACDDGDACTSPDACDANGNCDPGPMVGCGGAGGAGGSASASSGSTSASSSSSSTSTASSSSASASSSSSSSSSSSTSSSASSTGSGTSAASGSSGAGGPGGDGGSGGAIAEGGCSCRVGTDGGEGPFAWLAAIGLAAAIVVRPRRRHRM